MIVCIHEKDNIKAYNEAFKALFNSEKSSDPELIHEKPACIEVGTFIEEETVSLDIARQTLVYEYDWASQFKHIKPELITEEVRYWSNELFGEDRRFEMIVAYLQENMESKRAIVQFWKDQYRNLGGPAACLASVFFRVDGEKLHVHTHARASNASFLFFMDLQVMRAFQRAVAEQLGKQCGDFIFFTDSLHAYKSEADALQRLATKIGK